MHRGLGQVPTGTNSPTGSLKIPFASKKIDQTSVWSIIFLVGSGGFEPPKTKATDLQSVAFGRSANFP